MSKKYVDETGRMADLASSLMLGGHVRCTVCGYQVARPGLAGLRCSMHGQPGGSGQCLGTMQPRSYYVGIGN